METHLGICSLLNVYLMLYIPEKSLTDMYWKLTYCTSRCNHVVHYFLSTYTTFEKLLLKLFNQSTYLLVLVSEPADIFVGKDEEKKEKVHKDNVSWANWRRRTTNVSLGYAYIRVKYDYESTDYE